MSIKTSILRSIRSFTSSSIQCQHNRVFQKKPENSSFIRKHADLFQSRAPETLKEKTSEITTPSSDLKYFVKRTTYGKQLPVYSEIRNGGTRHITTIKRIAGDVEALVSDLSQVIPKDRIVFKNNTGHLKLKGKYVPLIREWLTKQGF